MSRIEDVQAVIHSAVARGTSSLDRFLADRFPEAGAEQIEEMRLLSVEIVESIPVFIARAEQEAEARSLQHLLDPVLELATRYFVSPIDLLPEMTHGLAGLLDDAYLVLRILANLDRGPEPFLDWELDEPLAFLSGLLGTELSRKIDLLALQALREAESHIARFWEAMAAEA